MPLETILGSNLAVQIVYPFLLVFVLIFAILEKAEIFGKGKYQINSLIALSIALIVVAFGWATNIIASLMPWLAIGVCVLLVFMVLYGFVASSNDKGLELNKNLKIGLGILIVLFVVVAVIVATGQWDRVYNSFAGKQEMNDFGSNIIIFILIVGAMAVVLFSSKKKKSNSE